MALIGKYSTFNPVTRNTDTVSGCYLLVGAVTVAGDILQAPVEVYRDRSDVEGRASWQVVPPIAREIVVVPYDEGSTLQPRAQIEAWLCGGGCPSIADAASP